MRIETVKPSEYQSVINEAWSSDNDLLNKWHIRAGEGLQVCVSDTLRVLREDTDKTTFHLYSVKNGNEDIGFFGSELYNGKPFLTTFFIRPEHRSMKVKDDFIKKIGETIGNNFNTALYVKNDRAVNWLVRYGAELEGIYETNKGDVVLLNLKL